MMKLFYANIAKSGNSRHHLHPNTWVASSKSTAFNENAIVQMIWSSLPKGVKSVE
jgi:hypothetical protein